MIFLFIRSIIVILKCTSNCHKHIIVPQSILVDVTLRRGYCECGDLSFMRLKYTITYYVAVVF